MTDKPLLDKLIEEVRQSKAEYFWHAAPSVLKEINQAEYIRLRNAGESVFPRSNPVIFNRAVKI